VTSPSLELQGAIVARLKQDPAVAALVGDRIYDDVPGTAVFPYVSLGPSAELSDDVDCIVGFEITFQIDAWSRAVGSPEVRRVADAVRRALTGADITLADNALLSFEHRQTRVIRDPDGLTSHAAIAFDGFAEQP
jgi:hypothetical protein